MGDVMKASSHKRSGGRKSSSAKKQIWRLKRVVFKADSEKKLFQKIADVLAKGWEPISANDPFHSISFHPTTHHWRIYCIFKYKGRSKS